MESLSMHEEDKEMYVSVFERVYKEEGRMEGRVEGRVEGRNESCAEIAGNMFNRGLTVEQIAEYMALSIEEVEAFLA